ncbi:TPA: inovirus Gp2 family protein [Serratia fonticola]
MSNINSHGPLNTKYVNRIQTTLNNSLREHHRTLVLRIDLRLPELSPYNTDSTLITRFMESIKSQKNADQIKKISNNKRCHPCRIRYAWAREFSKNGKKHYHIALFLNKDAYAYPGTYKPNQDGGYHHNLALMIMEAWVRALKLDHQKYYNLVHFPDNCYTHLDINEITYPNDYDVVMKRLCYLAKDYSKDNSDGQRNFGCSQY